jgi:hypothetical protein
MGDHLRRDVALTRDPVERSSGATGAKLRLEQGKEREPPGEEA